MLGLAINDIDWQRGRAHIRQVVEEVRNEWRLRTGAKSLSSAREIALPGDVVTVLT